MTLKNNVAKYKHLQDCLSFKKVKNEKRLDDC